MNDTWILVSACAAAGLGGTAIISLCSDLLFRDRLQIQKRIQREFRPQDKTAAPKSPLFRDLKMLHSKTSGDKRLLRDWWLHFQLQVERSSLPWTPEQIMGAAAVGCPAAMIAAYLATANVMITLACGAVALIAPFVVVEASCRRRRGKLCQQLPDAFDQMKRAVRAGQTITMAMRQIAADFPSPLADEFAMCCQQQELGLPQAAALQDLARRVNIMELQLFVVAVLVQRDVGGNSVEMLGSLSNVVRQRFRLASRVKALTGEGRMQAVVLGLLPVAAGVAMMVLNPEYAQVLLDRPKLLAALFVSEIVGGLWIRQIVNFEY